MQTRQAAQSNNRRASDFQRCRIDEKKTWSWETDGSEALTILEEEAAEQEGSTSVAPTDTSPINSRFPSTREVYSLREIYDACIMVVIVIKP